MSDRQNSEGDPCPPWCVTDHVTPWGDEGYTFTFHGSDWASVEVAGRDRSKPPAEVTVQAVRYAATSVMAPAVLIVNDDRIAGDGRVRLDLSGADAGHLAALVETLAKATSAEHRELAAAIRAAAALITGEGDE